MYLLVILLVTYLTSKWETV